jgi:hypothetical protein
MTKTFKKPKPDDRRKGDQSGVAFTRGANLAARDPLAYAAALQVLG